MFRIGAGEGLGQHGEKERGGVWDEHLHVPLMIRVPGIEATRVDDLLSTANIVPTLMGLIELPSEDVFLRQASGADRLAEHAELPLVFGQESSAPPVPTLGGCFRARRRQSRTPGRSRRTPQDPLGAHRATQSTTDRARSYVRSATSSNKRRPDPQ